MFFSFLFFYSFYVYFVFTGFTEKQFSSCTNIVWKTMKTYNKDNRIVCLSAVQHLKTDMSVYQIWKASVVLTLNKAKENLNELKNLWWCQDFFDWEDEYKYIKLNHTNIPKIQWQSHKIRNVQESLLPSKTNVLKGKHKRSEKKKKGEVEGGKQGKEG